MDILMVSQQNRSEENYKDNVHYVDNLMHGQPREQNEEY